jgi:hypothetical protein
MEGPVQRVAWCKMFCFATGVIREERERCPLCLHVPVQSDLVDGRMEQSTELESAMGTQS